MEEVTRHHYDIRSRGNHPVDCLAKRLRDIGFSLVDAAGGLPVVLPDAEVGVGDVRQFHGWRMIRRVAKGKNAGI